MTDDELHGSDRNRASPPPRDEGTAELEAVDAWRDLGGERRPTGDSVLCAACRRVAVPVWAETRRLERVLSRVLRARGERPLGDQEIVLCEECSKHAAAQREYDAQREHDEWTRLWLRFRADRVTYLELPETMRVAWDRQLRAVLIAREQTTSRTPSGRDL